MGRRGIHGHRNTDTDHCTETRSLKKGTRDGQHIRRPEQGGHNQKRQGAEDRRAHPISRCQGGPGAGVSRCGSSAGTRTQRGPSRRSSQANSLHSPATWLSRVARGPAGPVGRGYRADALRGSGLVSIRAREGDYRCDRARLEPCITTAPEAQRAAYGCRIAQGDVAPP